MNRFKINVDKQEGNVTYVSIEPLEQGYGHTLGNSLRRTLLTSLEGAAISSVKITGVSHQFSTISGVTEDAIQIILNLKKVRVKIYGDKPIKLTVQRIGRGEIKAGDIDTGGNGEIANPDQHIATLTDAKAKLNMEMMAEKGVGYIGSDERAISEIGVMAVDSIFTPILAVNYTVDQTRVGRRTDFEKLNMIITSDGTISAVEAIEKSAKILGDYYKQIYDPQAEEVSVSETNAPSFIAEDLLKSSVEELDLPVRITNALKAIDIDTIGKLLTVQPSQLMKAKNLGAKSLTLISEKLGERGLSLGEA